MANRRWSGAVMLIAVLLAIAVSSRVTKPGVVGEAFIAPLQPPAQVGDCVLDPSDPSEKVTITDDLLTTPGQRWGACDTAHFGEIYALLESSSTGASDLVTDCFSVVDPSVYLGFSYQARDTWVPTWVYSMMLLTPGPREHAAGQRWAACAVTASVDAPLLTAGSLRNVFTAGAAPSAFAYCTNSAAMMSNFEGIPCAQPHSAQLIGSYYFTALDATQEEVQSKCRAFAAAQTGIPGLESRTDLQAVTFTQRLDGLQNGVQWDQPVAPGDQGQTLCLISAPDRQLVGSLLSLGTSPIPWA